MKNNNAFKWFLSHKGMTGLILVVLFNIVGWTGGARATFALLIAMVLAIAFVGIRNAWRDGQKVYALTGFVMWIAFVCVWIYFVLLILNILV